jgi:hypothetical protein
MAYAHRELFMQEPWLMHEPPTGREIYYHGNHPIKWVRITGVIIAVDEFSARRVYTVDDSSGVCIECTCPAPPPVAGPLDGAGGQLATAPVQPVRRAQTEAATTPSIEAPQVPWADMDVGAVVKIKGKPGTFRGVKQVEVIKVEVLRSTEQEVRCWNEVLAFREEVLRVPWVVSREVEDGFRRRAERGKQYKSGSRKRGKSKVEKGSRVAEDKRKGKDPEKRRGDESDDGRLKRDKHDQKKRRHEREEEGLNPENRANYPSLAARKRLAGKYDALGI